MREWEYDDEVDSDALDEWDEFYDYIDDYGMDEPEGWYH